MVTKSGGSNRERNANTDFTTLQEQWQSHN